MNPETKKLVKELTTTANINLGAILDKNKLYSAQGAKNAAAAKLEQLLPKVIEEILTDSRTLVILDNVTKKLDGLNDRQDAVVLDFMAFEKKLIGIMYPKNGTKERETFTFGAGTTDRINTLLYDHFVQKVNVASMDYFMVKATKYGTVKTRAEAEAKLSEWFRDYDTQLKPILLRHELYEETKKKTEFDSLTVIIYNVPPWAYQGLYNMTGKTVVLSGTGEEDNSIAVNDSVSDTSLLTSLKAFFGKGETQDERQ